MGKIIFILILIMTVASVIYAASLKTCKTVKVKRINTESCVPANPIGKFVQENFGFSF